MAIRWKVGELDTAAKAIEAHNRRIRAFNKRSGGNLPTIPWPKTMLKGLESRSDLNRVLKSLTKSAKELELVTTRGGVELTKWEKREIEKSVRRINLERAHRNKLIRAEAGILNPGNRVQMGMLAEAEHRRKAPLSSVKKEDFSSYMRSVRKQADPGYWKWRDERYLYSYVKAVENNFGYEAAQRIERLIGQFKPFEVVLKSTTNEFLHIEFVYDEVERAVRWDLMEKEWVKLVQEYVLSAFVK